MGLRKQLLLLGSVFLLLPVTGFLFIREIEQLLRAGQQQVLLANAFAAADRIESDPRLIQSMAAMQPDSNRGQALYLHAGDSLITVDGYADTDEWPPQEIAGQPFNNGALKGVLQLQQRSSALFALLDVNDQSYQFHDPSQLSTANAVPASGDFVLLVYGTAAAKRQTVLRATAPGAMEVASQQGERWSPDHSVRAFWRDTGQGYQVEMQLPAAIATEPFTMAVFDQGEQRWLSNMGADTPSADQSLARLVSVTPRMPVAIVPPLQQVAEHFTRAGYRVRVVSSEYWLLADTRELPGQNLAPPLAWLIHWLFQDRPALLAESSIVSGRLDSAEVSAVLNGDRSAASWYRLNQNSNLLRMAVPIELGAGARAVLVLEQSTVQWLALTNSAFRQLLLYSGALLALLACALFGYASWLSIRIRRLNTAAERAVNADGSVNAGFPSSGFNDEIGQLSHNYGALLARVGQYNDYLKSLAGKLSHELRTPLAIVQSSLDNLAASLPAEVDSTHKERPSHGIYIERAQQGVGRLGAVLTAMNSVQRIEDAIHGAERERLDLYQLLINVWAAYQPLAEAQGLSMSYPSPKQLPRQPLWVLAAPDLIVQMLDKLFDNALDFTHAGGEISWRLHVQDDCAGIGIDNDGPVLPEHMEQQVFASLVSVREPSAGINTGGDSPNLGLGLYIVKLVVDFHAGRVTAHNRADGGGVCFDVTLPLIAEV